MIEKDCYPYRGYTIKLDKKSSLCMALKNGKFVLGGASEPDVEARLDELIDGVEIE